MINPSNVRREGSPPAPDDAMRRIDAIHNRWWFDAILTGQYPKDILDDFGPLADAIQPGDLEQIAQPLEWIGINYYFDILLRGVTAGDATNRPMRAYPTVTGVDASRRRARCTPTWDGRSPRRVSPSCSFGCTPTTPNLPPLYITENGCAYDDPAIDGRCADPRRIEYLDLHLRAVKDAIDEGVDVRGYYQWSLMDNFEWALGYDKRFGIVHVDFDSLVRTPKDSAHWYRDVINRNGLASDRPLIPESDSGDVGSGLALVGAQTRRERPASAHSRRRGRTTRAGRRR